MRYDRSFYQAQRGRSATAAAVIAPLVHSLVPIRSVLDVGCGMGTWLAAFRELGVQELQGIDGPHVCVEDLAIPRDLFRAYDLRQAFDLGSKFDLVVSIEVAEHLPQQCAATFIETLARHGDAILFSAALPFQGGVDHVNEQWPSYWAELFRQHGFDAFDLIRPRIWNHDHLMYWYKQNLLLYARGPVSAILGHAQAALRDSVYDLIHPQRYLELADPDRMSLRRAIRGVGAALRRKFAGRE